MSERGPIALPVRVEDDRDGAGDLWDAADILWFADRRTDVLRQLATALNATVAPPPYGREALARAQRLLAKLRMGAGVEMAQVENVLAEVVAAGVPRDRDREMEREWLERYASLTEPQIRIVLDRYCPPAPAPEADPVEAACTVLTMTVTTEQLTALRRLAETALEQTGQARVELPAAAVLALCAEVERLRSAVRGKTFDAKDAVIDALTLERDALREALRGLYEYMQTPPGKKRLEIIDHVLGLVHNVMPEMVERDQAEQRALLAPRASGEADRGE